MDDACADVVDSQDDEWQAAHARIGVHGILHWIGCGLSAEWENELRFLSLGVLTGASTIAKRYG